jgi:hypothetical protein
MEPSIQDKIATVQGYGLPTQFLAARKYSQRIIIKGTLWLSECCTCTPSFCMHMGVYSTQNLTYLHWLDRSGATAQ